jgi:hypothetical protein
LSTNADAMAVIDSTFSISSAIIGDAPIASVIWFSNGKVEFWSKGPNAFVTENNKTIYSDGVAGTVRYTGDTAISTLTRVLLKIF